MTLVDAENLLASGFKHYSPFGRFCPVTWSAITSARLPPLNPLPAHRYTLVNETEKQIGDDIFQDRSGIQTCAAVYRECVYWFNSEEDRKSFCLNPIKVINDAGDMVQTLKHQPLQVMLIGNASKEREECELYVCVWIMKLLTSLDISSIHLASILLSVTAALRIFITKFPS